MAQQENSRSITFSIPLNSDIYKTVNDLFLYFSKFFDCISFIEIKFGVPYENRNGFWGLSQSANKFCKENPQITFQKNKSKEETPKKEEEEKKLEVITYKQDEKPEKKKISQFSPNAANKKELDIIGGSSIMHDFSDIFKPEESECLISNLELTEQEAKEFEKEDDSDRNSDIQYVSIGRGEPDSRNVHKKSIKTFSVKFEMRNLKNFYALKTLYHDKIKQNLMDLLDLEKIEIEYASISQFKGEKKIISVKYENQNYERDVVEYQKTIILNKLNEYINQINCFTARDFSDFRFYDKVKRYVKDALFGKSNSYGFILVSTLNPKIDWSDVLRKVKNYMTNYNFKIAQKVRKKLGDFTEALNEDEDKESRFFEYLHDNYVDVLKNFASYMEIFSFASFILRNSLSEKEELYIRYEGEKNECRSFEKKVFALIDEIKNVVIYVNPFFLRLGILEIYELMHELNNEDSSEGITKIFLFEPKQNANLDCRVIIFSNKPEKLEKTVNKISSIISQYGSEINEFSKGFNLIKDNLQNVKMELSSEFNGKNFELLPIASSNSIQIISHKSDIAAISEALKRFLDSNFYEDNVYEFRKLLNLREFLKIYEKQNNSGTITINKFSFYIKKEALSKNRPYLPFSCLHVHTNKIMSILEEKEKNIEDSFETKKFPVDNTFFNYLIGCPKEVLKLQENYNVNIDLVNPQENSSRSFSILSSFAFRKEKSEDPFLLLRLCNGSISDSIHPFLIPISSNGDLLEKEIFGQNSEALQEKIRKSFNDNNNQKAKIFTFKFPLFNQKNKNLLICYKLSDLSKPENYIDFFDEFNLKSDLREFLSLKVCSYTENITILLPKNVDKTVFEEIFEFFSFLKNLEANKDQEEKEIKLKKIYMFHSEQQFIMDFSDFIKKKQIEVKIQPNDEKARDISWFYGKEKKALDSWNNNLIEKAYEKWRADRKSENFIILLPKDKKDKNIITIEYNILNKTLLIGKGKIAILETFLKEDSLNEWTFLKNEEIIKLYEEKMIFYAKFNTSSNQITNFTQILYINFLESTISFSNGSKERLMSRIRFKQTEVHSQSTPLIIEEILPTDHNFSSTSSFLHITGLFVNIDTVFSDLQFLFQNRREKKTFKLSIKDYRLLASKVENMKIKILQMGEKEIECEGNLSFLKEIEQTIFKNKCLKKHIDIPKEWYLKMEEDLIIVEVEKENLEYQKISVGEKQIRKVERIQNIELFDKFYWEKMTLKNKRGNTFEQKTLYYASNMHEPSQIFSLKNEGFDSRIYANGNSNGEGIYLFESLNFAKQLAYLNKRNELEVIQAQALIGKIYNSDKNDPTLKKPPQDCDCVLENTKEGRIFIIYESNKIYPEYLITFSNLAK